MSSLRIGELLSKNTQLTSLDVQEILAEQNASRRPFGQIALEWGLCRPEDLWRAWFDQLDDHTPTVKLHKIGVDSRVVSLVPRRIAEEHQVMPLRMFEDQVLLAIDHAPEASLKAELTQRIGHELKFVVADSKEIQDALRRYYAAA